MSDRYQQISDAQGNVNNVYDPKTINRSAAAHRRINSFQDYTLDTANGDAVVAEDYRANLIDLSPELKRYVDDGGRNDNLIITETSREYEDDRSAAYN